MRRARSYETIVKGRSRRLSQLAVLVKILCLLMVVMTGAAPSTVRSVSLYSTCSRGNITIIGRQIRASARTDKNAAYQRLTTMTDDFRMRMYIYAEKSKRYICFTKRWKMVAVPKKKRDRFYCMFTEVYSGRYLRYHSVHNTSKYIGFNKLGDPITSPRARKDCFNFIKVNPYSGVERHNEIVASKSGMKRMYHALRPQKQQQQQQQQAQLAQPQQAQPLAKHHQQQPKVGGLLMNSLVPSESSALQQPQPQQQQQQQQQQRKLTTQEQQPHHHRHKHTSHVHKSQEAQRRHEQSLSSGSSSELLRAEAAAASSKY